jgi:hypothetical protein
LKAYAQKQNKPPTQASIGFARSSTIRLRAKLRVSAPGDVNELEADRVAARVISMPEPRLERLCACGGCCPKCQKQQRIYDHSPMEIADVNDVGEIEAPSIVNEALRSSGQPLDSSTRSFMDSRFGYDFSSVRIHTSAGAAASAKALNAMAYTVGNNVAFGTSLFAPHSAEGKKLLAHELTHVVQNHPDTAQRQTPALSFRPLGMGTVDNKTKKKFLGCASAFKPIGALWMPDPRKWPILLESGKWGNDNPIPGPKNDPKLADIDFVFPSDQTPINEKKTGMFKIGSNAAIITPDPRPNSPNNSRITSYAEYWEDKSGYDKRLCSGF